METLSVPVSEIKRRASAMRQCRCHGLWWPAMFVANQATYCPIAQFPVLRSDGTRIGCICCCIAWYEVLARRKGTA